MGRRRQGREFALQALYLSESGGMSVQEALLIVRDGSTLDEATADFAFELAVGAADKREELDVKIRDAAKNWALERMAAVDRNLLRLASYELLRDDGTPPNVVIDEALEIAKVYATAESTRFINGILDKIRSGSGSGSVKKTKKKKAKNTE